MRLKKIAILIALGLAFGSCQKEPADPVSDGTGELTLNVSTEGMPITETRAASTDTDLKVTGFYLAGYHTDGGMEVSAASAYPNVFNHEISDVQDPVPLVKLVSNKFTLKTIKWTLDDATYLSFFGWSQSKAIPTTGVTLSTTGIFAHTKESTDTGYPWLDIRNADAPAAQTDVVGSRSLDHWNNAVISAVDLDFRHLLSKLTFKAKSTSKANVTFTAVNIKYATNKVYKKARYTFGSDVATMGTYGSFAEYHTGTVALNASYASMTNGAEVTLGSDLLIPQMLAAGDVSLEIKYKLSPNSGTLPGVEQVKTLPLSAFSFEQGKNYVYTIDVQATEILVMADPVIEPWNISGTSLPVVAGPKGDVLLLLDGYDKPYKHTDGKWYWLDRSGYNRHVALGTGYVSYDGPKHGYVFKKGSTGGVIPDMGSVSGLTVNLVSECTGTATNQQPFNVGKFYLQLPYENPGSVDWNFPPNVYMRWTAPSRADVDKLSFWSATYGNSRTQIYNNASLKAEKSVTILNKDLTANTLAPGYDGRIFYLKITAAERTAAEITADYSTCSDRFGIPPGPHSPSAADYVVINGVAWTRGNLVAASANTCKVGMPADYGIYFLFGSLVGWTGGADGSGVGIGSPRLDKKVWPIEMGSAKPTFSLPDKQGDSISTLSDYFFNYSMSPWESDNPSSDIGTFAMPMPNDAGQGDLRNGRYAKLGVGDPCTYYLGDLWRLPTQKELLALKNAGFSGWTSHSNANGRWFGPNAGDPATSIFLPAAGHRYGGTGNAWQLGSEARYGTSSVVSNTSLYYMYISNTQVNSPDRSGRNAGLPIRCVKIM